MTDLSMGIIAGYCVGGMGIGYLLARRGRARFFVALALFLSLGCVAAAVLADYHGPYDSIPYRALLLLTLLPMFLSLLFGGFAGWLGRRLFRQR